MSTQGRSRSTLDRGRRRRRAAGALAFWGAVALLLVYHFPYFRWLQHANELPRMFTTMALVEEGTYAIDTYRRIYGYRKAMDISRSFCLSPRVRRGLGLSLSRWARTARRRGLGARTGEGASPGMAVLTRAPDERCVERHYANKAPGQSLLAVPVYAALRLAWRAQGRVGDVRQVSDPEERQARLRQAIFWSRLTTSALPAFLFLLLLSRWLRSFVEDRHLRRVAVASYGLGTLAYTYSAQLMSHQLAAALLFSAFILVHLVGRRAARPMLLLPAGLLGGASLATDYQLIFAAAALSLYALWVIRPLHRLAWAVVGAAGPVALLLHFHHSAYGSVYWTGYEFLVAGHDQALHARGILGMGAPRWDAFWGSFFAPDNGLFYFSPWLLPALGGLGLVWRRRGELWAARPGAGAHGWLAPGPRLTRPSAEALFHTGLIALYVLFISGLAFWRGGWQTGPRYVAAMLPAFVLPYALVLQRVRCRPLLWALVVGPALMAIWVYFGTVATFPHFPEKFRYPLFDLVGPLLADGFIADNLGRRLLGLSGRASLLPAVGVLSALVIYLAMGRFGWPCAGGPGPGRRSFPSRVALGGVLAVCVGVWILAAYHQAAMVGIRRARSTPVLPGSRETYGAFLRRAHGDIRRSWEPPPRRPWAAGRGPGRRR